MSSSSRAQAAESVRRLKLPGFERDDLQKPASDRDVLKEVRHLVLVCEVVVKA
jgi:hypothetical protein